MTNQLNDALDVLKKELPLGVLLLGSNPESNLTFLEGDTNEIEKMVTYAIIKHPEIGGLFLVAIEKAERMSHFPEVRKMMVNSMKKTQKDLGLNDDDELTGFINEFNR